MLSLPLHYYRSEKNRLVAASGFCLSTGRKSLHVLHLAAYSLHTSYIPSGND